MGSRVKIEQGAARGDQVARLQAQLAIVQTQLAHATSAVTKCEPTPEPETSAMLACSLCDVGSTCKLCARCPLPALSVPDKPAASATLAAPEASAPAAPAATSVAEKPGDQGASGMVLPPDAGDVVRKTLLPSEPATAAKQSIPLPQGIEKQVFNNKADRATLWAKYQRSLTVGASKANVSEERVKRSSKCPEHILKQLAGAHERTFYFHVWLNCGQDWAGVTLMESHLLERRHGTKKTRAWMTDGQLMKVFQDREVVDALKEECVENDSLDDKRVRPHPRVPHCKKATQYNTEIEDHMIDQVDNVMKRGIRLEHNLDGPDAEQVVRPFLAQSRSAFGAQAMGSAAPSLAAEANLSQPEAIDERKRPLSTAAATSSPGETEVAETEEEKKKRQRLEWFEQQEEIKQKKLLDKTHERERTQEKRRLEREQERETRRMQAQTLEGRARIWLNGLQSHIRVCATTKSHSATVPTVCCRRASRKSMAPRGLPELLHSRECAPISRRCSMARRLCRISRPWWRKRRAT